MEVPEYIIKPSLKRLLVPQFLRLILLCALFYLGVFINLKLLDKKVPLWFDIALITFLLLLAIAQIFITKKKASNWRYEFYSNRIEYFGDRLSSVLYSDIPEIKLKRNVFDLISNTSTIVLGKFKMNYVSNYDEIAKYINNIIENYKQQQYKTLQQS